VAFKKEVESLSALARSFCDRWPEVVLETCIFNGKSHLLCMDVASPGMSGIVVVWLCDNKEQLCAREPCSLAFLCFELS